MKFHRIPNPEPAVDPVADLVAATRAEPGQWFAIEGWESDGTLSPYSDQLRRALRGHTSSRGDGSRFAVSESGGLRARYVPGESRTGSASGVDPEEIEQLEADLLSHAVLAES